ncbi:hypothetical protein FRB94_002525 [Tulasnella sp. JGI-2019a]|nr:hypothetical protein FRB93_010173 [Tulasnella sp. JGI-2019a]KAG9013451.1 hypothetical protein FRB94_002525 [Tulasnella sp. JGI-2019a]
MTFDNVCTRYLVFLAVLFEEVAFCLPQIGSSKPTDISATWARYLKEPLGGPSPLGLNTKRDKLYEMVSSKAAARLKEIDPNEKPEHTTAMAIENAQKACAALVTAINPQQTGVQLLLYFDEAHPLTTIYLPGTSQPHYYALRHTFTNLTNIFVIFLSTTSALSKLATPATRHPSTRVTGGNATLRAPFAEFTLQL